MRITEQSLLNSNVSSIRRNFVEMDASQRRLSTGQRVQYPHQDVYTAVNSIFHRTRLSSIDQFQRNIDDAKGSLSVADSAMTSLTEVMQRARELAVMGANGTYTKQDRINMAAESDELLARAYEIGQTKYKDEYLFGGTKSTTQPLRSFTQWNEAMGREIIVGVNYEGDGRMKTREIEEGQYANATLPGNYTLWATNSEITSSKDASTYLVPKNTALMIDNTIIRVNEGDNIDAVVDRINAASTNVRANVAVLRNGAKVLRLESFEPHKIMLEDIEGGKVLQDLGLIREGMGNFPENNYHPSAGVGGKSIYDALMNLRDNFLKDDQAQVGSTSLGLIDQGLSNILHNQAKMSATVTHIDTTKSALEDQKVYVSEAMSKGEDVDYAGEIVNFNMWEYAHKASLMTAAKLLQPTLMDFLR
ncbi:MAG: flagellar hook-associated protein 3 [Spirochaetes bacterium]|nr:flagellar hook-associated protein 3 [Spirochaetota bacterium]